MDDISSHFEKVCIRNATTSDLRNISQLHREQFANHFLGQYPVSILVEFYRTISREGIFLVAELDANVVGFLLGMDESQLRPLRREFVQNNWAKLVMTTLVHPSLWYQALRRLGSLRLRNSDEAVNSSATWCILSIAVAGEAKGCGVASSLVSKFESNLVEVPSYSLSVHENNSRAIGFYQKIGFVEYGRANGLVFFLKTLESGDST